MASVMEEIEVALFQTIDARQDCEEAGDLYRIMAVYGRPQHRGSQLTPGRFLTEADTEELRTNGVQVTFHLLSDEDE